MLKKVVFRQFEGALKNDLDEMSESFRWLEKTI